MALLLRRLPFREFDSGEVERAGVSAHVRRPRGLVHSRIESANAVLISKL